MPVIRLNEFLDDTQEVRQGVQVNVGNWQQQLEANKQAFFLTSVQRQRFKDAFPSSMKAAEFVAKLDQNAGSVLTAAEKTAQAAALGATPNDDAKRSQALRSVVENVAFERAEFNRAFVLMQYFSYLRRDPAAAPDSNYTGYDFWLTKLNQFSGNYIEAEMVRAFISSDEYRKRFGQ